MTYITNPKTKSSGIKCAIPQPADKPCPMKCKDCFCYGGRSYLEPLEENLPNMPEPSDFNVFRINDGNDSHNEQELVIRETQQYKMRFYNTTFGFDLEKYDAPVVVTINPDLLTDVGFYKIDPIPKNLMFVRFRANTWNTNILDEAVEYYTSRNVVVVVTFMAYNDSLPKGDHYVARVRTLNMYWAITEAGYKKVMKPHKRNLFVYCCGKWEGDVYNGGCRHCGNCLREYFATMERMNGGE